MGRPSLYSTYTQTLPPKPAYTEKNVPDLQNKVYIVTGGNAGVGKELTQLLYLKNATIYLLARSETKALAAIKDIKTALPESRGKLIYINLDLADLDSVKSAVAEFLSKETKLDVLFNNAGVLDPPGVEKSKQGYEIHLAVNNIGTFLLTKLLTPILRSTAQTEPAGTVRVIWLGSFATEMYALEKTGLDIQNLDYHVKKTPVYKYSMSKVGNWMHSVEYARRHRSDGIVSVSLNPGALKSELFRSVTLSMKVLAGLAGYPPINGAYTELYAGLSPDITLENSGCWVVPFGRIFPIRKDLVEVAKIEEEGGTGGARKFWDWTEEQIRAYV